MFSAKECNEKVAMMILSPGHEQPKQRESEFSLWIEFLSIYNVNLQRIVYLLMSLNIILLDSVGNNIELLLKQGEPI